MAFDTRNEFVAINDLKLDLFALNDSVVDRRFSFLNRTHCTRLVSTSIITCGSIRIGRVICSQTVRFVTICLFVFVFFLFEYEPTIGEMLNTTVCNSRAHIETKRLFCCYCSDVPTAVRDVLM